MLSLVLILLIGSLIVVCRWLISGTIRGKTNFLKCSKDFLRQIETICIMWLPVSALSSSEHIRIVLLHSVISVKDLYSKENQALLILKHGRIELHSPLFRSTKRSNLKTRLKWDRLAWFSSQTMATVILSLSLKLSRRLQRIIKLKTSFSEFPAPRTELV